MAINKKLIHFNTFENFNSKKLSANKENTQYTLGVNGSIMVGDPEILYQSIVYIKDTQLQWTHGLLYNGENLRSDLDSILDGTSVVAKALNDANGNNIADTYATEQWVNEQGFITIDDVTTESLLKTYTFQVLSLTNLHEQVITQEELEKIQNADIVYVSDGTTNIQLTLKTENDYISFWGCDLRSYPSTVLFIDVSIQKISDNITVRIYSDPISIDDYISDSIASTTSNVINGVFEEFVDGAVIEIVENIELIADSVLGNIRPIILLLVNPDSGNRVYLHGPHIYGSPNDLPSIKFIGEFNDLTIECVLSSENNYLFGTLHVKSKQDKLVSGINIKTINGQSILGSGDIIIEAGTEADLSDYATKEELNSKQDTLINGTTIKTINGQSILGEGDISNLAEKSYVDNSITELVDGAPETLNTLNELAAALKDNADIVDVLNQSIGSKQDIISDIETIRQGAAKGLTSVQQGTLSTVATSGSYNDLTNKPTIPNAVTESTVSGWGFTKNAGTYIKPSTGIPKTDLASAVQTSLAKADTALQTETYKGTITGVSANGTSIATSGVANIPAASTSKYGVTKLSTSTSSTSTTLAATASAVKQAYDLANGKQDKLVSGTNIKTINGESILGSGNITISGGSSSNSGGNGAYSQINHGTSDTTFALTPNTFHVWNEVTSLDLSLENEITGVMNEYIFQFTSGETATSLSLPSDIKWVNDLAPEISSGKIYLISILSKLACCLEFIPNRIITFTLYDLFNASKLGVTTEWLAVEGMTWRQWVESEYSLNKFHIEYEEVYSNTGFASINGTYNNVDSIIVDGLTYNLWSPLG